MIIRHDGPEISPALCGRLGAAFLRRDGLLVFRVDAAEKSVSTKYKLVLRNIWVT